MAPRCGTDIEQLWLSAGWTPLPPRSAGRPRKREGGVVDPIRQQPDLLDVAGKTVQPMRQGRAVPVAALTERHWAGNTVQRCCVLHQVSGQALPGASTARQKHDTARPRG